MAIGAKSDVAITIVGRFVGKADRSPISFYTESGPSVFYARIVRGIEINGLVSELFLIDDVTTTITRNV